MKQAFGHCEGMFNRQHNCYVFKTNWNWNKNIEATACGTLPKQKHDQLCYWLSPIAFQLLMQIMFLSNPDNLNARCVHKLNSILNSND